MTQYGTPELAKLVEALGATAVWRDASTIRYIESFTVRAGDVELQGSAHLGSKGALMGAYFTLKLPQLVSDKTITLRREGALDRLGKALAINREVSTGDAVFDRAVYVESDASDNTVLRLLASAEARSAALAVLGVQGPSVISEIEVHGMVSIPLGAPETLRLEVPCKHFTEVAAIRAALAEAARLGGAIVRATTDPGDQFGGIRFVRGLPLRWGRGLGAVLVGLCFALTNCAVDTPPLVDVTASLAGIGVGLLAWLLVMALIVAVFRGRSSSFRNVIMLGVLYVFLFPLGITAMKRADADLDHGLAVERLARAHLQRYSKGPTDVVVELPDTSTIHVPLAYVRGAKSWDGSQEVLVTVSPGALGWEWVVAVELKR